MHDQKSLNEVFIASFDRLNSVFSNQTRYNAHINRKTVKSLIFVLINTTAVIDS